MLAQRGKELLDAQNFVKAAKPGYKPPLELANKGVYGGVALSEPEQSTSYRDAFGKLGVDPRDRIPQTKEEMKFASSTRTPWRTCRPASRVSCGSAHRS